MVVMPWKTVIQYVAVGCFAERVSKLILLESLGAVVLCWLVAIVIQYPLLANVMSWVVAGKACGVQIKNKACGVCCSTNGVWSMSDYTMHMPAHVSHACMRMHAGTCMLAHASACLSVLGSVESVCTMSQ
jgi:hypothetical protein